MRRGNDLALGFQWEFTVSFNGRQRQADAPGFLNTNGKAFPKKLLIFATWAVAVFLFASQWYAYDGAHGFADPFILYVGWSC